MSVHRKGKGRSCVAQIDDLIATYLNAVETEGKSVRTIK